MSVPVYIITGFLGSGKTTLMNRLLRQVPAGHRPAIVVNDFGEVGIDGALLEGSGYAMKELASGCVCCTLRGPLSEALLALVEEQQPDSILLETTGVAQPAQLLPAFDAAALSAAMQVDNVVCVIDGNRFLRFDEHFPVMSQQVSQATTVLINKIDLASTEEIDKVRQRVTFLTKPEVVVIETQQGDVPLASIYCQRSISREVDITGGHSHTGHLTSVSFEDDRTYRLAPLLALIEGLQPSLIRAKGIVRTEAGSKLIQVSLSGTTVSDWSDLPRSRLVFIGEALQRAALTEQVAGCVATD